MFNSVASSVRSSVIRASFADLRTFHSTPTAPKAVTEKVSDVADKVNKKVGKGLASAIEKGEQVTKETLGSVTGKAKSQAEHASAKAEQMSNAASEKTKHTSNIAGQKLNQVGAGAREIKENIQEEMTK